MTIPTLKEVHKEWKKKNAAKLKSEQHKSDKKQRREDLYHSEQWRNMSKSYRMIHPLCEMAAVEGEVRLSNAVHHVVSFMQRDESLSMLLLLDEENIISVCNELHGFIHGNMDMLTDKQKEWLHQKQIHILDKYAEMGYYGIDTTSQYSRNKYKDDGQ